MDSQPRKLAAISRFPIRWADLDLYNHVNNVEFFRYMEQARVEMLESQGVDLGPQGDGIVVVHAACTFLAPMSYPGTVEVRTFVGPPGRSSFQTTIEIRLVGDDKLYAEGSAKIVWTNPATGKSLPLPARIRSWLEAPGVEN